MVLIYAAALMAVFPPSSAKAAKPDLAKHTLTIQSSDELQFTTKDEKSWYERGPWPLVGTSLAILVTNSIAVAAIYIQSSRSFNALLRQRKIERLTASLNEFYNPLSALLDINKAIFDKTGPSSFPEDYGGRTAAASVWKETKKKILDNNILIEDILRNKTHLLEKSDSLTSYHELLVHVAMYETFQKVKTDLYKRFFFPSGMSAHIENKRMLVLAEYYQAVGEQI